MFRVAFVNMPFADWNRPSFALSQLTSLVRREFPGEVEADVHYLNQDFAERLGPQMYESLAVSHDHVDTGLGDWLFRQVAFPAAPDTADEYFRRFYRGARWTRFRSQILDLRAELASYCNDLIDRHELTAADVVGFSSMFAQHVPSIALARLIKLRSPATLTVIGGANCEAPMGAVVAEHVADVDCLFSGPALLTFPSFLRNVLNEDHAAIDEMPGIVTARNCREPQFRVSIGRDQSIDEVLRPDFSAFQQALESHPSLEREGATVPTLFFETSRGCWWGERSHCTFCGLNGQSMGYRAMAADHAVDQFKWLFGLAPKFKHFFCTDNVMPRNYPREVFEKLDPPPDVSIFYEVKLPLSRHDMARMAQAGVTIVQPGIEALATSTLKLMGKGTTAFQNLRFLKQCEEFGIEPLWNLLIGFPGEDPEVYRRYVEILPQLVHLRPPNGVFMVRFDRYSPYFTRREEFGLDLQPMDYYSLTYPFPEDALREMAYFFADHNLAPYMMNAVQWHDQLNSLIESWRDSWYTEGAVKPELKLTGSEPDGWVLVDSRRTDVREHRVSASTVALLNRITSPVRRAQIPLVDVQTLDWLESEGMLFDEDGKVVSLVQTREDEPAEDDAAPPGRRYLPLLQATTDR